MDYTSSKQNLPKAENGGKKMAKIQVGVRRRETGNWTLLRQRQTLGGDPSRRRACDTRPVSELVAMRGVSLAKRIGVEFRRIEGGSFICRGGLASGKTVRIEAFDAAETPFTIGMMKRLLEERGDEVNAIFTVTAYSVGEVVQKSLAVVAADVPEAQRDECPLVHVSQNEAEAIALLLESSILTQQQWERAASGRTGKSRPWGEVLDQTRAVYADTGTRPVNSKPAGVSAEGICDLIGNVWEWTKTGLYGGAWNIRGERYLRAGNRDYYSPTYRSNNIGFRIARAL